MQAFEESAEKQQSKCLWERIRIRIYPNVVRAEREKDRITLERTRLQRQHFRIYP